MRPHDVARNGFVELLDESHGAVALLTGTLVASPVLLAALSGRQAVTTALGLYLAALVGAWLVVGLLGGALTLAGHRRSADADAGRDPDVADEPTPDGDPPAAREPEPVTATR